jgi:HEAT repeat protein
LGPFRFLFPIIPVLILIAAVSCEHYNKQDAQRINYILASKDPSAHVQELVDYLSAPEPFVRYRAAYALFIIADSRAVAPLIAALDDSDLRVRMYAASALGKIGDTRALAPLIGAMEDPAFNVRYKAANALGMLGDPGAIPVLKKAAEEDEHVYVRNHASRALKKIMSAESTSK